MSRVTSRPRVLLAVAFGLAMLLIAETAVLAVTTTKSGGQVKAIKVVTETALTTIGGAPGQWADVPGMSVSMVVPRDEKALFLITFSASTACGDGSGQTSSCVVHVTVNGSEAIPGAVPFESAADGNFTYAVEANSMQFVAGPVVAGTYTIKVQAYVTEVPAAFQLTNRTLSVLRSKV